MTALPAGVRAWLDNPDGGGAFTGQADAIRAHDPACCEITFFWEGLRTAFDDCPHSNHWYCACCRAAITTCGCTEGDQ